MRCALLAVVMLGFGLLASGQERSRSSADNSSPNAALRSSNLRRARAGPSVSIGSRPSQFST